MRSPIIFIIILLVTALSIGYLGISAHQAVIAPTSTFTPTPWGTPPWADRWVRVGCAMLTKPTPNAEGRITVVYGVDKICYDLPPDDVGWQIVEAAVVWGLPGGQVTRCKSPTECAVEVGEKRDCYLARWYPAGHPDWPQGGWTFRPAPEGFPCRPCVPGLWCDVFPPLPYGTPTPTPAQTPIYISVP